MGKKAKDPALRRVFCHGGFYFLILIILIGKISIESTGMWLRGRQKPTAKRYAICILISAHKCWTRMRLFLCLQPYALPTFCVGVPSAIQQGIYPQRPAGSFFAMIFEHPDRHFLGGFCLGVKDEIFHIFDIYTASYIGIFCHQL